MPFWKKSEDPWDIAPEKRRHPPAAEDGGTGEAAPGLLEELRDWNEKRKEEKARRETLPPMPCPWCGREMEVSCLFGGRDGVYWRAQRTPDKLFFNPDTQKLDTDGPFLSRYKLAWYCPDCGKLVLDIRPGQDDVDISQSDRDCEEELRRYAEQAKNREEEH